MPDEREWTKFRLTRAGVPEADGLDAWRASQGRRSARSSRRKASAWRLVPRIPGRGGRVALGYARVLERLVDELRSR
jgi:hypothetical protein